MARSTQRPVRGAVNPPRRGVTIIEQPHRAPTVDDRREKFVRQLATRTEILLKGFNNLRKLADREYYPHTEKDLEVIGRFLDTQVEFTKQSFKAGREVAGGVYLPLDPEAV